MQGCHVIVTSRPHTLSHLQSAKWFLALPKRMVSLDIQGLSEEGVASFIHRYVLFWIRHPSTNLGASSKRDIWWFCLFSMFLISAVCLLFIYESSSILWCLLISQYCSMFLSRFFIHNLWCLWNFFQLFVYYFVYIFFWSIYLY